MAGENDGGTQAAAQQQASGQADAQQQQQAGLLCPIPPERRQGGAGRLRRLMGKGLKPHETMRYRRCASSDSS